VVDVTQAAVMKIALALLCMSAVTFLLRILAALVIEAKNTPASAVVHFAKFKPRGQRRALIEMKIEVPRRKVSTRTGERIAL
jgi:branched-subunit amino acid transport protein